MNTRRMPFQFKSIDPAKRQAELEKRFGLTKFSDNSNKMHLDLGNHSLMGMKKEPSSASSSPRLQHRVPIFVEGVDDAVQSKANIPMNVDAGQKPRVRVVPIEVETDDLAKRARAFSGDPYTRGPRVNNMQPKDPWFDEPKPEVKSSGPRVCNIPIKVERGVINGNSKSANKEPVVKTIPVQIEAVPKPSEANDCESTPEHSTLAHEVSLKKIAVVLDKLVGYQADVEKFSGTSKEKQYRYLDEMLTRLMLDLDNVETMGNEEVRLKRKEAIRKVQHCLDLLESRLSDNSRVILTSEMPSDAQKLTDEEMKDDESKDTVETDPCEGELTMEAEASSERTAVVEISEVVDDSQVEIVSEPIVSELNESDDAVESSLDETLAKDPEVTITEVIEDSDLNQSMEVEEVEEDIREGTVADETVCQLELDQINGDISTSNSIPNSKVDTDLNNESEIIGTGELSQCNLPQTNS